MYQPQNFNKGSLKFSFNRSDWKSNLRERCRRRIKEDRNNLYNSSRNLPNKEELKSFVIETIRDQWKELKYSDEMECSSSCAYDNQDLDEQILLEELENELLLQEKIKLEKYLLKLSQEEAEYRRYLEELQEDNVMCPLCQEKKLTASYGSDGVNQISCSGDCSLSKKVPYGMVEIRKRLETAMNAHSGCPSLPGFTFTKEDSCLYLVCSDCGTIYFVM